MPRPTPSITFDTEQELGFLHAMAGIACKTPAPTPISDADRNSYMDFTIRLRETLQPFVSQGDEDGSD